MPSSFLAPRVKICGITRSSDAAAALALGVDAIGLVFYAASPRAVTLPQAQQIAKVVGPFVSVTGLFVNADTAMVNKVLQEVPLQVLQFHGDEPADFCAQFGRPWIKAVRVKAGVNVVAALQEYRDAAGILFDTYKSGVQGGTGEVFDWNLVSRQVIAADNMSIILAGGLNAANVSEAVRCVRPYAVDVSGGVESEPGKKDPQKMAEFVNAAKCHSQKL